MDRINPDRPVQTSIRKLVAIFAVGFTLGLVAAIFSYTVMLDGGRSAQDFRLESGDYIVLYESGSEVPNNWILVNNFRDVRQGDGMKFDIHIDGQMFPFSEGSEQVNR